MTDDANNDDRNERNNDDGTTAASGPPSNEVHRPPSAAAPQQGAQEENAHEGPRRRRARRRGGKPSRDRGTGDRHGRGRAQRDEGERGGTTKANIDGQNQRQHEHGPKHESGTNRDGKADGDTTGHEGTGHAGEERRGREGGTRTPARGGNPEEAPKTDLCIAGRDEVARGESGPTGLSKTEIGDESTLPDRVLNHALTGSAPARTAPIRPSRSDWASRSGRPARSVGKNNKKAGRTARWVSRHTCSARFRTAVASRCPGLGRDDAYWKMMELLVFTSARFRNRPILIPHPVIADVCGVDPHDGGFRSGDFLAAFQRDVLQGFSWREYDHGAGRVREVATDGIPPSLLAALALEMAVRPREVEGRVHFASGFAYDTKRDPKALRETDLRHVTMLNIPETEDQRFIQAYLHGVSVRRFSFLDDTFDDAYETALLIESEPARHQAMRLLHRIYIQPVPYYSPVGNSLRLFSMVGGLQQVHRGVRKALMRGCWDLDGDAMHLAIMARVWDIPELQAFLEVHGAKAIWRSLTAHVAHVVHGRGPVGTGSDPQSDPNPLNEPNPLSEAEHGAYKAAIKHGVYALGYGGGPPAIAEQVESHDDDGLFDDYDAVVDALKSHELLGRVFEAKDRMVDRIKGEHGMRGAYGFIRMKKGRDPLSVLAMVSSSYEMALMRTVFDVAAEHADLCTILLYQFDGVTVRFRGADRAGWVIRKMQAAFDAKARALGIHTALSSERL